MKIVAQINAILDQRSPGGESFDDWFWTNGAFERHSIGSRLESWRVNSCCVEISAPGA
jgi:hypothetical protein